MRKEDLVQVNPQLYDWLRIFNTKPSDKSVAQTAEDLKKFSMRDSDGSDLAEEQAQGCLIEFVPMETA